MGRHLFEKCVCGILATKARILVTHQLQFLKSVEQIILLDSGKVQARGTYTDLLASGIDFAQLLLSDNDKDIHSVSGSPTKASTIFGRVRTMSEASATSYESRGSPQRKGSLSMTPGESILAGIIIMRVHANNPHTQHQTFTCAIINHYYGITCIFFSGDTYTVDPESDTEEADIIRTSRSGSPSKQKMLPDSKPKEEDGPEVLEETTNTGDVKWSLYWKYFRAGGGYFVLFLAILSSIITQILFTGW